MGGFLTNVVGERKEATEYVQCDNMYKKHMVTFPQIQMHKGFQGIGLELTVVWCEL